MAKPKKPDTSAAPVTAGAKAAFPKNTLEDALALPEALQRNGGQPLDPIDAATAMDRSPGSSGFRTVTASSSSYGLTGGSHRTNFTMRDTGQAIVQPTSSEEKAQALVTAALTPSTFRSIYDYYRGKKFPERRFFINTVVREFGVDPKQVAACVDVFTANMKFVGLIKETPGGDWLANDATPVATATTLTPAQVDEAEAAAEDAETAIDGDEANDATAATDDPGTPVTAGTPTKRRRPNRIFIGHGRNHIPLDQLTKTLDTMRIPYAVAEVEATVGRPISQKVRDTMSQCGAAILIFSADIEYFDKDGASIWRPSENVSHELGAASVMYEDRIILFKEESVQLASNYSGIGYITFEKDALDAKVNDLLRELVAFNILKLSLSDDE